MSRRYYASTKSYPEFSREPAQRPFVGKSTAIVFGLLVVAISVTCIVKAIPERQKLRLVEAELADTLEKEAELQRERRRYEVESSALKTNQSYLETRSRDRLYLYRAGESVIELD